MTAPRRRVASLMVVVALVAGCSSTVRVSPSIPAASPPAAPSLTPVPGGRSPDPSPAASLPSTTETEFGRIWDAVPPSFPRLPYSSDDQERTPASAVFVALVGDPPTASTSIARELTAQGWTVDAGSPLEDGSIVLEATAEPKGCKAEIRFTPLGGSVIMSVLLAAACPFS